MNRVTNKSEVHMIAKLNSPGNAVGQGMLTIEQCEKLIDGRIEKRRGHDPVHVDVVPVSPSTLTSIVTMYRSGGWSVETEPLRMPNGYTIVLV